MASCVGRGPDGQHCCQIDGGDCQFLTYEDGVPRCGLFDQWDRLYQVGVWVESPIGVWFAANHPGFTCPDWPQNLPDVMAHPTVGKCCFEEAA